MNWTRRPRMKVRLFVFLLLVSSCYSVPTVTTTSTAGQQDEARAAAKLLSVNPTPPGAIERAQSALDRCADALRVKDLETVACSRHLSECGKAFEEKDAALRELKSENGFFSKMGLRFQWFAIGFGSCILAGILLYFTGSLAQIAARFRA